MRINPRHREPIHSKARHRLRDPNRLAEEARAIGRVAASAGGNPIAIRPNPGASLPSANALPIGELVDLSIPRDLAVHIVGSDAGKEKRMRPHGAMTQGAMPQENAAVESFMKPFLDQEIDRVQNKRTGRPAATYVGKATVEQALALKAYCDRFAKSAKQHLVAKGHDDRQYRTKQRLEQARALIRQINAALGLPADDGRSLDECIQEILGQALRLRDQLRDLRSLCVPQGATVPGPETAATPARDLVEFLTPLNALLERIRTIGKS